MHQWCSQFASRLEQLSDGKGLSWLSMLLTRLQDGIQIKHRLQRRWSA
jgi:hypothetical protein